MGHWPPARLARRLHLVYDGASLSARMDHDPSASAAARAVAEVLLDAALAEDSTEAKTGDSVSPAGS